MIKINMYEAVAAVCYMVLLMSTGFVFKSMSRNINDYLKAGCRGTWWLIGMNTFMASFSAMTFTAIAGQSFVAGWSPMIITLSGAGVMLVHAFFLAPLFRQMRVTSSGDVLYKRFGRAAEQFSAYYGVLGALFTGALTLLGTATFVSTVFGFPVWMLIIIVGLVVTIYASFGGAWGIMAADFIQASILIPVTISITVLCLIKAGGLGNIMGMIDSMGLSADFALIKSADHVYQTPVALTPGLFTWSWLIGLMIWQTTGGMGIGARYISVKDGKEAKKAALMSALLLIAGAFIWYIPPIVARLMYYDNVMAVKCVPNVADTSFAVVCADLLPRGLIGVMAMAILSATMSSMDGTFNGTSALVVRNVYPPLARLLGYTPTEDSGKLLLLGRCVNFVFGAILVLSGLYFAKFGLKKGLYSYMLNVMAVISVPMATPLLMAMIFRKAPSWAFFSSFGSGLLAALFCFCLPEIQESEIDFMGSAGMWIIILALLFSLFLTGRKSALYKVIFADIFCIFAALILLLFSYLQRTDFVLLWQHKLFITIPFGMVGWLVSMPFWKTSSAASRERIEEFYHVMHTSVDFRREVGEGNDLRQLKLVGIYVVITGLLMSLLMLIPNPVEGRILIGIISLIIVLLGLLMWFMGVRSFVEKKIEIVVQKTSDCTKTNYVTPTDVAPDVD